ncbi:MAG TPA: type II secretion system protein GspE, partial [Mizugakiibacter sp.]
MAIDVVADKVEAGTNAVEARVCARLVERGRLKEADLARARRVHEEAPDGTLTALLTRLGLVSERDMAETWAELLDLPLVAAKDAPEAPPELALPVRFLKQHHVVPLAERDGTLELLVADPADTYPAQAVALAAGKPVALRVGARAEVDDLIERYYGQGRSAMGA